MGATYALSTAFFFAIGVICFKKSVAVVPPYPLNLFKTCLTLPLLFVTAVFASANGFAEIPFRHAALIFTSGIVGIGISDTLFFMTLSRLGASRTALVDCLYSPFVILFSVALLHESISAITLLGGSLIIGSVVVSSQRNFGGNISRPQFWAGCAFGVLSMATVAFAIVMVKPILASYPVIWISTIRVSGGLAFLVLGIPFQRERQSIYKVFRPHRSWLWIAGGAFFATYLSLITWLAGFKYSQTGTAALLNQTSTVFIVVFAAMFLKEPMTRLKLLAVAMAFGGAAILIYP